MANEYDALLEPTPTQQEQSPYDALLAQPPEQPKEQGGVLSSIASEAKGLAGQAVVLLNPINLVRGVLDIQPRSGLQEVLRTGRMLRDIVGGASIGETVQKEAPEVAQQQQAILGKYGPEAQRETLRGIGTQLGMVAAPFLHGKVAPIRGDIPTLSETVFGKTESPAAEVPEAPIISEQAAAEVQPKEVTPNAVEERQIAESNIAEHPGDATGGTPAEAVNSGGVEPSAPVVEGQAVAPVPPEQAIARPEPQEPLIFSVEAPTDVFGSEHTPVSSFLKDNVGGVVSKSAATKSGKLSENAALWDDVPKLSHPTHNKIYNPSGETPDVAAQALYDAGLIADPSPTTMWKAIADESKSARSTLAAQKGQVAEVKAQAGQAKEFSKAQREGWKQGEPAVQVRDLQVGDTVTVKGEPIKVVDIDPDTFDVTLEDGKKFGVQSVKDNTVIYGEHEPIAQPTVAEPTPKASAPVTEVPPTQEAPVTPEKPKIQAFSNPEMQKWFEGSKVALETGKPLVVYHGGPKFEGPFKSPAFFTESAYGASWYAGEKGQGNVRVQPYYLSIKKPLDITTLEGNKTLVKIAQDAGVKINTDVLDWTPDKEIGWQFQADEIAKHSPYDGSNPADLVYIPKVREALKQAGYDGLQVSDPLERSEIPTWVALDPDQIKPYTRPLQATGDDPHVSAIANRFVEERAAKGEVGEIEPGQGHSTTDLVQQGLKMPPEEINQHISDLMQGGGDPIKQGQAVRAEEARLSQRSQELSRVSDANPNDVNARLAADNAFNDLTDFHNGPIARLKQNWHAQGMGMQGEIPVDLSTFNGLREAWLKDTGEPPPASVEPTLRRTAQKVATSIADENGAMSKLGAEIEKATTRRKLPTFEEVRDSIIERMKNGPCTT